MNFKLRNLTFCVLALVNLYSCSQLEEEMNGESNFDNAFILEERPFLRGTESIHFKINSEVLGGYKIDDITLAVNNKIISGDLLTEGGDYTFTFDSKQVEDGVQAFDVTAYFTNSANEAKEVKETYSIEVDNYLPAYFYESGYADQQNYEIKGNRGSYVSYSTKSNTEISFAFYNNVGNRISDVYSSTLNDTVRFLIPEDITSQEFYVGTFEGYDNVYTDIYNNGDIKRNSIYNRRYLNLDFILSSQKEPKVYKNNASIDNIKKITVGYNKEDIPDGRINVPIYTLYDNYVDNSDYQYKYQILDIYEKDLNDDTYSYGFGNTATIYQKDENDNYEGITILCNYLNDGDTVLINEEDLKPMINYGTDLEYAGYHLRVKSDKKHLITWPFRENNIIGFFDIKNKKDDNYEIIKVNRQSQDDHHRVYTTYTSVINNMSDKGGDLPDASLINYTQNGDTVKVVDPMIDDKTSNLEIRLDIIDPNVEFYNQEPIRIVVNSNKLSKELVFTFVNDSIYETIHGGKYALIKKENIRDLDVRIWKDIDRYQGGFYELQSYNYFNQSNTRSSNNSRNSYENELLFDKGIIINR
ncbi:hypothetical protein [Flammeovirga aprica]|uniref:Uncharacterized protein n=1 Tax=Flammeovirga aprica JL-4 TaxID=694437 RepID=A0A7X9XBI7_9BACT|nr:hypothetical protein [Flammeovirga aprica]NME70780.1 hypothetical protein [Flammeovirga aprica JL-4]